MEVEKMEVDSKSVTVKKEETEQKMDTTNKANGNEDTHGSEDKSKVDIKKLSITDVKKEIKKEAETFIEIIPKEADLAYLVADGLVVEEENMTMTAEEVRVYIEKCVFEQSEKNNPIKEMNRHLRDVYAEIREKREEFMKLSKLIEIIERDQLRCLKNDKVLRKMLTKTGGVGVDLPVLPNSLPKATSEALLKKGMITQTPKTTSSTEPTRTTTSTPTNTTKPTSAVPKDSTNANTAQKPAGDIECIDLTDETEAPKAPAAKSQTFPYLNLVKHPAPLPPKPFVLPNKTLPPVPPKPRLKISAEERGIVLQWDMIPNTNNVCYAQLENFDIFGYQEQKNVAINTLLWKKIGTVKAMTLPMACTLTQFLEGNTYHFSIRAVDMHNRCGSYSDPISIVYKQTKS